MSDDRTEEQKFYRSLDDEVEDRDTVELDEEKGSFRTWVEESKAKINEKAGDGASAARYILTGAGMGYLLEKLSPIPIRLPKFAAPVIGGVIGGYTWYDNRTKLKNEREIRKEVRKQAHELEKE